MSPTSESSLANPHKQPEWRSTFRGPLALQMRTPKLRRELSTVVSVLSRFSRVRLFATVWTVARQAPLSMGFSREEYCSGLSFPILGDLPGPGIEPTSPISPTLAGFLPLAPPGKPQSYYQFSSVMQSCLIFLTPWTAAHQASLSITNSQSLLKFMSIESVMPSNHLILCRPLLLLPSIFISIRVFSNESVLRISWPKYWSFSVSNSDSSEYVGVISFRID